MDSINFIHDVTWGDLPEAVQGQARRCLLDTVGTAIGGRQTKLSQIIHTYASLAHGGQGACLWLDGRELSPPGAALANGMTIDSLDMHDGYAPVKGHAGAALVPAVLATLALIPDTTISGQELLTSLAMSYEIALRAGLALHGTACDYHTSGAWNALGCAAITARRLGSTAEQTRHALGIAEYHGPRSQMMRCIDHPTMLKDGSGWGAMAGVSAGMLANAGFSGAPALTIEAPEVRHYWADLGQRWLIDEQYFKPHAVCRWAQPAMTGALALNQRFKLAPDSIQRIRVLAFHEATRLTCRRPQNTEQAQYSLPFPVAATLVHGQLGPAQLHGEALQDPQVLTLSDRIEMVEVEAYNIRFPTERISRVQIETSTGEWLDSGDIQADWDVDVPPSDTELLEKFRWLAGYLPESRGKTLEEKLWHSADLPDAAELLLELAPAFNNGAPNA